VSHRITRRDFLDGVALMIGAGITPAKLFAQAPGSGAYPPGRTGWGGGIPESYEIAHAVREGRRYAVENEPVEESLDLVVVGAGISGLAAAYFFRERRPDARILILDSHEDFGGHARRNEFNVDGRLLISYGGSESIQSPQSEWSREASGLLRVLGVDVDRFETAFHRSLYPDLGLSRGLFFTREAFGVDKLVRGDPIRMVADDIRADRLNARAIEDFIADYPLDEGQKAKLIALFKEPRDVLPGLSVRQKEDALAKISYREYLKRYWGLSDVAVNSFQDRSMDFFALGIDLLPAFNAMQTGYPGFQGLGLQSAVAELDDPYIYHFPDGNASIARLLVRSLIPDVAPGAGMEDIVTAHFDYSRLDARSARIRIRLNSTVVHLRNRSGGKVDVGYVRDGKLHRVQAIDVVYAGYAMMLPYVFPDLGAAQKRALSAGVKAPLVYVKVAVRNWLPWVKQGVHEITNTMGFFSRVKLDYPVSLGSYRFPTRPEEPMVLHLVHVPSVPVGTARDQRSAWRAARNKLFAMSFADFERHVRDELTRMLGEGGFDADKDIRAITVNRWGHGYAYGFNSLFDEEHDFPQRLLARRPVGRVSIAGSDAAWSAYAHAAIDEAHRAVVEIFQDL
jgi:spermidine dehydrogenase